VGQDDNETDEPDHDVMTPTPIRMTHVQGTVPSRPTRPCPPPPHSLPHQQHGSSTPERLSTTRWLVSLVGLLIFG
jgi:hypothetical protein